MAKTSANGMYGISKRCVDLSLSSHEVRENSTYLILIDDFIIVQVTTA